MTVNAKQSSVEAFTFGDPESVLDGSEILDYLECWNNGRWYEPPISFDGLAKSFRANVHHSSAIYVKCNILTATFIPHSKLSRAAFRRWVLDYLTFGNGYLERRDSKLQTSLRLEPSLARYTRRGLEPDRFFFVTGWGQEHEFKKGSIFHLQVPDINQEIYGMPEYLSALQSAWLNEAATLFRRKYYKNGSHAGFIMYMTDAAQNTKDVEALRQALRDSKGPGNFRNVFMYAPNGKKDGLQVIPVSEVAAKDEFFNIKNATRDDVLAAHRVPPQLLSLVPSNSGGFGAVTPASKVFVTNELKPMQADLKTLNDWMGEEVVRFAEYELDASDD